MDGCYATVNDFNPRSHTGSDPCRYCGSNRQQQFQSTLPHGERRKLIFMIRMFTNFNPRSHTGSDYYRLFACILFTISIHAPTRGATTYNPVGTYVQKFQSTLPHGERRGLLLINGVYHVFQSTLPHGERQQYYTKISHIFIHM